MSEAANSNLSNTKIDVPDSFIEELREILGDRVSTSAAVRDQHGNAEDYFPIAPPDAVCFANSTEEVSAIVKLCARDGVPIIPFGTGTSLEGHVQALRGGITIDLTNMDKVLEVNAEDLDCRVQAGVTRKQLNEYLRDTGLFFPIDPGADASLGGMSATRASGTNAVRYGTMRENVLGLTVVSPDGRIIKTGGRAKKSAAGYDLTRLMIGSEGTFGVITEVQVKLYGIPEAITSAVCQYPSLEDAVNTVILTIQSGIPVARIELLDEVQMDACIKYSSLEGYEVKPTLFSNFTAPKHRHRNRRKWLVPSRTILTAARSHGPPRRRSEINFGRRATMPTTRHLPSNPAKRVSPPTPVCRFRIWRNAF